MSTETSLVVSAEQTDRSIEGRLYLTTEATCPICSIRAVHRHIDSHYSMGKWYGCAHVVACQWGDTGVIESVEFET